MKEVQSKRNKIYIAYLTIIYLYFSSETSFPSMSFAENSYIEEAAFHSSLGFACKQSISKVIT